MENLKKQALNIEIHYAVTQCLYWAAGCTIQGFTAVFLSYRGLSDSQTGMTVAFTSVMAILLQLVLSQFCDRHPEIPLKVITSSISVFSFAAVFAMYRFALPPALVALLFILADAPQKANSGLLNAMMVQYSNAGIPARFGWPRGVGSLGWAIGAYFFGKIIAAKSPDILLILFMGLEVFAISAMMLMPGNVASENKRPAGRETSSYKEMLRTNRALRLFLLSLIVTGIGQAPIGTFLNRSVELLGGGTEELGTAILIQSGMELPVMFISGFILKKFKPGQLLVFSFTCYTLKSVALLCCRSLAGLYAIMFSGLVCFGVYCFSGVLYVNSIVDADQKVRGQSLASLCFTGGIGGVLGSIFGGFFVDKFGIVSLYIIGLVLAGAGTLLMLLSFRQAQAVEKSAKK